jgi:C4-type Zn-finger protein
MKKNKLLCPICKLVEVVFIQTLTEECYIEEITERGIVLGEGKQDTYNNDARIECPNCESKWEPSKFIEEISK